MVALGTNFSLVHWRLELFQKFWLLSSTCLIKNCSGSWTRTQDTRTDKRTSIPLVWPKFWERLDLNTGQLGDKHKRYLCAILLLLNHTRPTFALYLNRSRVFTGCYFFRLQVFVPPGAGRPEVGVRTGSDFTRKGHRGHQGVRLLLDENQQSWASKSFVALLFF